MKTTLIVLAAGMGSRYGGLKQIDPVGPNGEVILDYSIYDAIKAGFGKIVFVIRPEFESAFRENIGNKWADKIEICYAYQNLDSCLGDFEIPEGREKPWGTGHAILVTKDMVDEPIAIINADDYYGPSSYKIINNFLSSQAEDDQYTMVGFVLRNTLSEHGHVSRGICQCDENSYLKDITETTKITKDGNGAVYSDENGEQHALTANEIVSMNLWGFGPSIYKYLEEMFAQFLKEQGHELKSEFYIPTVVDSLIKTGQKKVKVLKSNDNWFGVTYKEDKPVVVAKIKELIDNGIYPEKLI